MSEPLAARIALVVGAGSGIGRATSIRLAEDGATVICADIDLGAAAVTIGLLPDGRDLAVP